MRRAAFVMVVLYALFVTILLFPVLGGRLDLDRFLEMLRSGWYWAWLVVVVLGEAALLVVPVQVASRRPTSRRSLLWPIGATGILLALLACAGLLAMSEYLRAGADNWPIEVFLAGVLVIWGAWALAFYRTTAGKPPERVVVQQSRLLLGGSVLELLVAVPTHVAVRGRDDCCAGISTLIAIMFGLTVMFLSFGPGVLFLYAERWSRLRRNAPPAAPDLG